MPLFWPKAALKGHFFNPIFRLICLNIRALLHGMLGQM
jgi:hypothetical protein